MADASVIAGISAAVEAAPDNDPLRLHLAALLLDTDPAASLKHCTIVLGRKPDHVDALQLAARAAQAAGEPERAEGYRRLHKALAPSVTAPAKTKDTDEPSHEIEPPGGQMGPPPKASRRLRLVRGGGADSDANDASPWEVEKESVTLADVAGMDAVKKRLRIAFLEPLKNPQIMKAYGKSLRGGLLLYGPPGCGKTFIARATAG